MTSQTRNFRMDPKLLYDVMTRQAGSIEKAWLEAVMNSVDAGASQISFKIDKVHTEIVDDGKGMTREEVTKFFEVFGAPQEEGEDKVYGEFRMGRGQLFAFGINEWITKNNRMVVDIKNRGLNYDLEDNGNFDGCKITVAHYKPLEALETAITEFKDMIRWVPIPVWVNGENTKPEEFFDWTLETNLASFKLARGDVVKVYNQGVFVKDIDSQGVSGAVITKKPLRLNFARNDILDDCKVWDKVEDELVDFRRRVFDRMSYFNEDAKKAIIRLMYYERKDRERFRTKKVFRTTSGNWVSLAELEKTQVAFAEKGSRIADKIMQLGLGIVLDKDFTYCQDWLVRHCVLLKQQKDISEIGKSFRDVNIPIENRDILTKREKKNFQKLQTALSIMKNWTELKAGTGLADGWTDGKTYICINRRVLNLPHVQFGATGYDTLLHEVAHFDGGNSSLEVDVHGENFYKVFHDLRFKFGEQIREMDDKRMWK